MARKFIDRNLALRDFVQTMQLRYPGQSTYTREQVLTIGDSNPIGSFMFASATKGQGKLTRISRGSYIVPVEWSQGLAPWDTNNSTTASV